MLKQISKLKKHHKAIESKLLTEIKRPKLNEKRIEELRKLKRQAKELILKMIRQRSILRKKRYKRRARRLARFGAPA